MFKCGLPFGFINKEIYMYVNDDRSNAKALWANGHPMDSEELLTKQAEMVLAAEPGIPGEQPRVWVSAWCIKTKPEFDQLFDHFMSSLYHQIMQDRTCI